MSEANVLEQRVTHGDSHHRRGEPCGECDKGYLRSQIERFNSYVPDMHGQEMGIYRAADGKYVRYSDHERIVRELTSEREQIAQTVERMYGPHDRRFKTAIEPRCPRCGETKANHGNYATGEDWTCPDQDGYGYKPTRHR
jgi:hypothetical protein